MFEAGDIIGLFVTGVLAVLLGFGCFTAGKHSFYQEVCQKACPTQTAQVIESPTERVCMCGTKLEGTLVLELCK